MRRLFSRFRFPSAFVVAFVALTVFAACGKSDPEVTEADEQTLEDQRAAYKADNPVGRYSERRNARVEVNLTDEEREQIRNLQNIGYLDGKNPAPDDSGVTFHEPDLAYQGLNLYVSGHGPIAILMDMDGKELHAWKCDFDTAMRNFPEAKESKAEITRPQEDREFWRRAHLYPNGDLLAIFEGSALIKLDKDSNLLWAVPNHSHHDLQVTEDGTIYVLGRKARFMPDLLKGEPELNEDGTIRELGRREKYLKQILKVGPVLEDFVLVLDPDGKELRRISILAALQNSRYAELVKKALFSPHGGDIFHTNTLELLDGRHVDRLPAFKKGNVLLSMLWINTLAVLDLETEEIVWTLEGSWRLQHQPTLLDNGNLLIFDNVGGSDKTGLSRVLEVDPATGEVLWSFEGYPGNKLYSESCGSVQRFPNGNTLITETDNGRALEITSDKKIVWEFVSPHRAGLEDQLIASLFEVLRLPPDFPRDWMDE